MSKTLALNSEQTLWVTTYAGRTGRCYDFSMRLTDEIQVTHTFTENELLTLLTARGQAKGLAVPAFDNVGRPLTQAEKLEQALQRSDELDIEQGRLVVPPHMHDMRRGPGEKITTTTGGFEWLHYHFYEPGDDFTSTVHGHKHPVAIRKHPGRDEIVIGTSVPV